MNIMWKGTIRVMSKKKKIIFTLFLSVFLPNISLAQWCVYVYDYNQWLCNNVKGAGQACYAQPCQGNFQTREACESALAQAKARVSYDTRFQRMVYCKQIGGYAPQTPPQTYTPSIPDPETRVRVEVEKAIRSIESQIGKRLTDSEKQKLWDDLGEYLLRHIDMNVDQITIDTITNGYVQGFVGRHYLANMEREEKSKMDREISFLRQEIKITPPPMSPSDKEKYQKVLKDAWCIAYHSIQAAKLALSGNISVSKELETDLERLRSQAGMGFDKPSSCPPGIELQFKIPEVKMAIEKDEQYKLLTEVHSEIQKLLPEIEKNVIKKKELKAKKEKIEENLKQIENRLNQTKDQQTKSKLEKEKDDLLAQAREIYKEAEEQERKSKELEMKVKNAETKISQFVK